MRKELFPYLCNQNAIDMSVSFTLEKRTNSHDECPIRLSWSFIGERYQSTLGVSIKKEDWDEERRLVKANAQNHSGQSAEDINFLIKRVSTVVLGIEKDCVGSEFIVGKDMMRQAISDALAKDIARPEDIVERCVNSITFVPEPATRYYKDEVGRYYKLICDAKNKYNTDRFYILQQLFGRRDREIVPESDFRPFKEPNHKYSIMKYTEVSFKEAFGL